VQYKTFGRRTGLRVSELANASQLTEIAELVDSGKQKAVVETVLPLSEACQAQD
jgi:NADPH:quinone reductase-like Zn-dependent oxidoreductase